MIVAGLLVLAVVGGVNWWSRGRDGRRTEAVTKPLFTVLAGVLGALHGSGAAAVLAVVAFALCLVGDVALLPAVDRFVVGLGAFLAAHAVFLAAFVVVGLDRWWLGAVALGLLVPVLALAGRRILAGSGALRMPVTGYLVVISAMAVVAWTTGRPAALVGASAFVASDTILGWGKFVGERRWGPVAVMVTYHVALAALALSFG